MHAAERKRRSMEVKQIIAQRLDIDERLVSIDATLCGDLGADSLSIIDLVLAMEETYDIDIADDDVERMRTVGDIADCVLAARARAAAAHG
jgi:acyl carrier protein